MKLKSTILILTGLLSACGGDKEQQPVVLPPPAANIAPVANAGPDINAEEETEVSLLGSGIDSDGSIASFAWRQISGTSIVLSVVNESELSFTLPNLLSDEVLSFELTVTDNEGATHSDVVNVNVNHISWSLSNTEVVDVTGDGLVDLLLTYERRDTAAQQKLSRLAYRRNLGEGDFSSEVLIDRNIPHEVFFAKVVNLDGINFPDIVAVTPQAVWSYASTEAQDFTPRALISESWPISEDFSFSTNPVVLPNSYTTCLCLLRRLSYSNVDVKVADISGDGLDDLIWLSYASEVESDAYQHLLYRAINNGSGGFLSPELLQTATDRDRYKQRAVYLKTPLDIDGDDTADLVYSFVDHSIGTIEQRWVIGNDTDYQTHLVSFPSTSGPIDSKLIDWNEDGNVDVVSWFEYVSNSILFNHKRLYSNTGQATFSGEEELTDLSFTPFQEVADINADGHQDLISYNTFGSVHRVLWQQKLESQVEPSQELLSYQGNIKGSFDMNNDEFIDFISQQGNTLYWYQNNGNLTFTERQIEIANAH